MGSTGQITGKPAIRTKSAGQAKHPAVSQPSDWMFLQPAILDQMHDAILALDLNGVITGCNRAAQQVYGYSSEELVGQSALILYAAEDRHLLLEQIIPAVVKGGEYRGEMRKVTRAGQTVYVHLSTSLLRDVDGEPAGMVQFAVNITDQKLGNMALARNVEVEQKLRVSEENAGIMKMLSTALDQSEDVFLLTEAEPFELPGPRILYANPAFEKMTGYTAAEAIGQTPRMLQGPRTDRAALDRIRAALKAWKPVREELTNYRKDGAEFSVELSIVPIANPEGRYTHWFAVQRDISDQVRLRAQLAQGEARMHSLTEAIPQLLWTASGEGRCQFISTSCAQFMGVDPEQVYGHGWNRFIHPEDRDRATKTWMEAVALKQMFVTEYRLLRNDGKYFWYLHRAVPRFDQNGQVAEWIGSSTDIEQQKRSEEAIRQTEKLAAVGRLASSIAHEINNPLASVTNLLYLISYLPDLSRTGKEYVKTAQEELSRVSEITTQTLRFHNQSTAAAPARVSEVLDAVLAFYRPRLAAARIQVRREYVAAEQLTCFSGELRQVFANLIGNAIEASKPDARLRVRLRPSKSWRRFRPGIRVTIADTGHGMSPDVMRRIFEPFFTTKGITGTGLGLWISKDLLAKHDAQISVKTSNREGSSGTVISVFLPYAPALKQP